ncbi:MAG: STAS domain-containing protein [Verrucomicrobiota bacterium]|nr:STAS domain-containing protein [Verrucomicrobiota bacterium]
MDKPVDIIQVAIEGKKVFVRINGKGSFQNSPSFRQFYTAMLEEGKGEFFIDLQDCPSMDSTFLGTLAGLHFKLQKGNQGKIHILNVNERNMEVMKNLGINRLFSMDVNPIDWEQHKTSSVKIEKATSIEATKNSIEAHENLVTVNQDNSPKFKDVLAYLKEDLSRKTGQ